MIKVGVAGARLQGGDLNVAIFQLTPEARSKSNHESLERSVHLK
jgi:hypothetical protein